MRPDTGVNWDGSYSEGRLEVALPPEEVLRRIQQAVPLPYWEGGPMFSMDRYEGVVKGNHFWLRQRSSRGRPPKLAGTVEPSPAGSIIRYEIKTMRWVFLAMFVVPLLMFAVGSGVLIVKAREQAGAGDEALASAVRLLPCAGGTVVLLFGTLASLGMIFQRQITQNTRRFFLALFEDVTLRA